MAEARKLRRLDHRIRRSKRSGKIVVVGVFLVSLVFAVVLTQGLSLAIDEGEEGLVVRALVGLSLLVGLNLFSVVLIRRQHRLLDEAREELETLVTGDPSP
jgi:protein-S-isoprenylcysteine O-methyltransferase Ste14